MSINWRNHYGTQKLMKELNTNKRSYKKRILVQWVLVVIYRFWRTMSPCSYVSVWKIRTMSPCSDVSLENLDNDSFCGARDETKVVLVASAKLPNFLICGMKQMTVSRTKLFSRGEECNVTIPRANNLQHLSIMFCCENLLRDSPLFHLNTFALHFSIFDLFPLSEVKRSFHLPFSIFIHFDFQSTVRIISLCCNHLLSNW